MKYSRTYLVWSPRAEPGDNLARIAEQHFPPAGGEEVHRRARNRRDLGKRLAQGLADAAQEVRQLGADVVLGAAHLKREHAARRQLARRFAEEFERVEAVELSGPGVGQVDQDHVIGAGRGLEEEASVSVVYAEARVRGDRVREVLSREVEHRRVELDVIDPLEALVL